jgi:hypothetical protein
MTIKDFADELAAVELAGVRRVFRGIPKQLAPGDLPAQWADMPGAVINPDQLNSTFDEAAPRYSGVLYVAVADVSEGLPDNQRTVILEMAERVEEWARQTPYATEIVTHLRITAGSREYRGVIARVGAPGME